MDNYRFSQILRELIEAQNNTISTLNFYLQDVQNSNFTSYSESDYNVLQEQNNNLQDQIKSLNDSINGLQSSYESLLGQMNSGSASQNAEIEALRNLLEAVSVERDSIIQQAQQKDNQISSLEGRLSEKDIVIDNLNNGVSDYQSKISDLNSKLTSALNEVDSKNKELLVLEEKVSSLQETLARVKAKISEELEEAKSDIEEVLDTVNVSPVEKPKSEDSGYTAIPFLEITRYLKGSNVSLQDILCKEVLYQDPELTLPSPNEGALTFNGVVYATDGNGVIRVAGTEC